MRCDFSYEGDDIEQIGIYIIHPEFENQEGNVIIDREEKIKEEGTARMWVIVPEMRKEVHRAKVTKGGIGYFMVGSKRIAKAKIVEITGLYANPTS